MKQMRNLVDESATVSRLRHVCKDCLSRSWFFSRLKPASRWWRLNDSANLWIVLHLYVLPYVAVLALAVASPGPGAAAFTAPVPFETSTPSVFVYCRARDGARARCVVVLTGNRSVCKQPVRLRSAPVEKVRRTWTNTAASLWGNFTF